MKTNLQDIDKIKPYPHNPRTISAEAISKVSESIKEYGFQQPIVVDKKNIIVVGHTRWLAAIELNLKKVPTVTFTGTKKQADAYRIADNRTGEETDWNNELLIDELNSIDGLFTGFDDIEIMRLIDPETELDRDKEWEGMPEFDQEAAPAHRSLIVHFKDENGVTEFCKKLDRKLTDKTKYLWYPEQDIIHVADIRYESEDA